jgi:porin
LTMEVGRLFAGDVFATSPLWEYYVNSGVNGHLNSISGNIFFPASKITAWAVRVTYQPNEHWYWATAIYNADEHVTKIDNRGADFSFEMNDGYLAFSQLTYKHHQTPEENGLPGRTAFGCYYDSSKFQDLADTTKRRHGNYGLYLMWDQMLYRGEWPKFDGPEHLSSGASAADKAKHPYHPQTAVGVDRPTGLTLWGAGYLAPQDHINTQTYELAGGLLYQGFFPSRKRDMTAFCAILGHFSDQLNGQGIETVLELNHRFQLGPWFYITPDVQYIVNPSGRTSTPNALVLGFETSITF